MSAQRPDSPRAVELDHALEQLAEARRRLDLLAAEQARALEELGRAERRRGSLAFRLAGELRARLGR